MFHTANDIHPKFVFPRFLVEICSYSYLHPSLGSDNHKSYLPFSQRMVNFRKNRLSVIVKLKACMKSGRVSVPMCLKRYQYWKHSQVANVVIQSTRCKKPGEESGQTPISRKVNSIRASTVLIGATSVLTSPDIRFWLLLQLQTREILVDVVSQFYHVLSRTFSLELGPLLIKRG